MLSLIQLHARRCTSHDWRCSGACPRLAWRRAADLIGIDRDGVGDALRAQPEASRSALLLESAARNAEGILDDLIDDLADLAFARFPQWYGRGEMTVDELIAFAKSDPNVSAPWLRAAAKRAAAGYVPRLRRTTKQFEFVQLMQVVDACNPMLIAHIDPVAPERAAPVIAALEWCTRQGASVVAALAARPPAIAPYDRVLYGALDVVRDVTPAQARFIAPRSRAHHASAIEQRVEAALQRDPELRPLFSCNEIVPIEGCGLQPRVDLLWREGRVVVELDGPEHQSDPNFANDRHRDYELLVSGYLVLRITNDQVETDLQHAIEKIRAVVRFRRTPWG
jgi:uncharacterized protein DUF559